MTLQPVSLKFPQKDYRSALPEPLRKRKMPKSGLLLSNLLFRKALFTIFLFPAASLVMSASMLWASGFPSLRSAIDFISISLYNLIICATQASINKGIAAFKEHL